MANYRTAVLLDAETATTAATKIVDIDMSEVISRLRVEFKATNNGSTPTAHPANMISKMEVVDGSDVIYSLSGLEANALQILDEGKQPYETVDYLDNNMAIMVWNINFGRWLWDPELALDPKKFRNLQLKITHNLALGGAAPDAATLSVFADVFDEKAVSPKGFLMAKEVKSYSLTSSAEEPTDLPTDYAIRKLMLMSLSAAKQPWEQYNKVKLTEDKGRKLVIDSIKTSDLLKITPGNNYIRETIRGAIASAARTFYITGTQDVQVSMIPMQVAATGYSCDYSYGGTVALTTTNSINIDAIVTGKAPHGALVYPFGDQENMTDWYVVNKLKSLNLTLTAGSSVGSSSTCQIVVQQMRSY